MQAATLYLIRHATPDWSRRDLPYHLPPGPPLNAEGLAEARALGDFMRQEAEALALFTSPLERCEETARLAGHACAAPVTDDDRLMEWQPDESHASVAKRLQSMLETSLIIAFDHRKAVGLVTHGGPVGVLLELLGMEPGVVAAQRRFDHKNPLPPAAVWKASREAEGEPWLLELAFIPNVTYA
jgi:broad specificity phosphatase PhoE